MERAKQPIFRLENKKSGLDSGYSRGEGNLPCFDMTKNCRGRFEILLKVRAQDRRPFITPLRSPVENAEKITGGAE
jgi:hypothetical protein